MVVRGTPKRATVSRIVSPCDGVLAARASSSRLMRSISDSGMSQRPVHPGCLMARRCPRDSHVRIVWDATPRRVAASRTVKNSLLPDRSVVTTEAAPAAFSMLAPQLADSDRQNNGYDRNRHKTHQQSSEAAHPVRLDSRAIVFGPSRLVIGDVGDEPGEPEHEIEHHREDGGRRVVPNRDR